MTQLHRFFLLALLAGFAAHLGSASAAARPNILFIYADDLGYGDLSCYNPRSAWRTPHLDGLARDGIRFTDAHSSSGVCTPSRYSLLTGRYSWRGRLKRGVVDGYGGSVIEPGRTTVASFLRQHGYVTALFGKWHLGLEWARKGTAPEHVEFAQPFGGGPRAHGFERFFGISASLDMPPYVWLEGDRAVSLPTARVADSPPPKLWRAGPISADFKMEDVQPTLIAKTAAFLEERAAAADGKPFFVFLALASPHTPLLPTPEFAGRSGATPYGDFMLQVDADVGRLLATLDRTGLAANTLVIFTADNGFAPAAGLPDVLRVPHDPSGGLRGHKSDLYEGGHRVPLLARWPDAIRPGTRSGALVGQVDFFATCAELLGVALPDDAAEDSISVLGALRGEATGSRESLIHHSVEGRFAIREGRWKLLLWPGSGGWSSPTPQPSQWLAAPKTDLSTLPKYQLFDLAADPAETSNLAAEHPEIVRRLGATLRAQIEAGATRPGGRGARLERWPQLAWFDDFP